MMKKRDKVLFGSCMFLLGIVFGFLLAPIKQGIGNNCGNSTRNYYGIEEKSEVKKLEV